jgi:L-arabinose transport system permease protein
MVANETGSTALGILAGLVAGVLVGILNGIVIARFGINALITTLATMQIVRGSAYLASDGKAVSCRMDAFNAIGNFSPDKIGFLKPLSNVPVIGEIMKFTTPVWVTLACFIIFGILLNRTTYGRNTLAIGGNKEAARLAGINVTRTKLLNFVLQGLIAALAGVIIASRLTSGQPKTSEGLELRTMSACVLGGVSLSGGVATITGVVVGVLIMGSVQNIMDLKNIDSFWQLVVSGLILLAAVLFDRLKQRRTN